MKKQQSILKIFLIISILSTAFIGIVFSRNDQENVDSGTCGSCHETPSITITTNYTGTGNSISIQQGQTFDIEITASGQNIGSVWVGYAFWHTGSDGIQLPDTTPFIAEDILVNEWNDGSDYYSLFSWQTVVSPMTRTFRITTTSSAVASETLVIQVAGQGDTSSNVISFGIDVIPGSDSSPPLVTITSPTDNSYVKGSSVPLTAIVDDGLGVGVDTVWAEITNATYNQTVSMTGTEPNYSGLWDLTDVADGTYTLTVKAKDIQIPPNINDTESITIKVDNNAPSIALESIVPNPSNGVTTITVSNSSSDIDGNGVRATISPPTGGDIYLGLNYQGGEIWNNTFTVTQTGKYDVTINATDYAGNTATIGPTTVRGDVTDPSVSITYPQEGQLVGGIVPITGIAMGTGSNIASISINDTIWGDASQNPQIDFATGSPSGVFVFENKSYIIPIEYWVEITVTDEAGNVNTSIRNFNVTSNDISPPILITYVSADPSNGFTNITVISTEDLDAGGPPLLNITLPSSAVIYRPMYLIDTRTWRTDYTVISDGTHTINVNATDEALNVGYAIKSFEGDITAPNISLTVTPDPSNGLTTIYAYNTTETVTSILANISTPSGGYLYDTLVYLGSNQWIGTFIVTETGTYIVYLNGTDVAGNVGYNSSSITGNIDGPSITIVSISPNPSDGLTTITVSNSTTDIDGNGIRANISTPSAGIIYVNLTYQGSNQWTGTFNVTEEGTYVMWINATNILGNPSIIGPSNISGDFSAPVIVINSPAIGDSSSNAPNFNVTITDILISTTWYSIFDGNQWSGNITFSGTTGTIDQTLWDSLSNGELIIRFYANDSLGNLAYVDTSLIKGIDGDSGGDTEFAILLNEEQFLITSVIITLVVLGGIVILMTDSDKKIQKK